MSEIIYCLGENNKHKFGLDYQALKATYNELVAIGDNEFRDRLPEALHLACVISFMKGLSINDTLSDIGVIHELAHIIHYPETDLVPVRDAFKKHLRLV